VSADSAPVVRLGEISGVHGLKGWVKVRSFTEPRSNLIEYRDWLLDAAGRRLPVRVEDAAMAGGNVIAKLAGIDDRDRAMALVGAPVFVERAELPPCAPGEYYWADLEGLEVRSLTGTVLGEVAGLMATGANDVIVLSGPGTRLIPYLPGQIVRQVDLVAGVIIVDWDETFWE
jgi:16S rRNA processing protein RimM